MASKKTTPKKKAEPKKQAAKKTTAKKAAPKKQAAKKSEPKKQAVKKAAPKKPVANVNVTGGSYTTSTSTLAGDVTITMTASPQVQDVAKAVSSTLVQMNDIKNKGLRKRMLAWFKRS